MLHRELKVKEQKVKAKATERRVKERRAKAKAKESYKIVTTTITHYQFHSFKGPGAHEKKRKIHVKLKKAKHLMKEKGHKLKVVVKVKHVLKFKESKAKHVKHTIIHVQKRFQRKIKESGFKTKV